VRAFLFWGLRTKNSPKINLWALRLKPPLPSGLAFGSVLRTRFAALQAANAPPNQRLFHSNSIDAMARLRRNFLFLLKLQGFGINFQKNLAVFLYLNAFKYW
jgi:hypothetical protein